jgi:hypothetical protein
MTRDRQCPVVLLPRRAALSSNCCAAVLHMHACSSADLQIQELHLLQAVRAKHNAQYS